MPVRRTVKCYVGNFLSGRQLLSQPRRYKLMMCNVYNKVVHFYTIVR